MTTVCPACGSQWLDARYDYDAVAPLWAKGLNGRMPSLWRYAELLPEGEAEADISMFEGYTPLIRLYQYERKYAHAPIFVKDERQGPTSSFKDRQAAAAVTALKRAGIKECVLASTGNAGAAYAAYCARAGIQLWLFVSDVVPAEKLREAALYGAHVVKITGSYDDAKQVAAEYARRKGIHLDRGARTISGKESMKTLGFEIAEQLGLAFNHETQRWICPDWYIQAVSGGIGPLGVWKAFEELYAMRLIDKLPKLGIIQAAGCAPMVSAFEDSLDKAHAVTPHTLIHVLATGDPGFSYVQLRKAALATGGTMLAIEDGDTFAAMRRLASTAGLSVEPATAVAFAGLERMLNEGMIDDGEIVVVNCSGHTFPAESHVLGDQYLLNLELSLQGEGGLSHKPEELVEALSSLDEQIITILLVDDNANDRRLLRRLLKAQKNYRIFEAESGKAALRLLELYTPDLIISDLTMPGMDGLTMIEQLKWNPDTTTIPIIVLSAKSITPQDSVILKQYADSVWEKGGLDTRALVRHIMSRLHDSPQPYDAPVQGLEADAPYQAQSHILIIHNTHTAPQLLRSFIEQAGHYEVSEADNGRDGLKSIYEHHPDLVFLDVHLTDMDSEGLMDVMHNDPQLRQIPVIVYSGNAMTAEYRDSLTERGTQVLDQTDLSRERIALMLQDKLSPVGY
jgi:threonine synthase